MLQLDHNKQPVAGQPASEPHPVIVDDSEELEVERILDFKRRYRKLHYLVQWAGYNHIRTSREPFENLDTARERISVFHPGHTIRPRR